MVRCMALRQTEWSIDGDDVVFILPDRTQRRERRTIIDNPITMARLFDLGAKLTPYERRTVACMLLEYEMGLMYPKDKARNE
jgi:hypothetical protein